MVDEAKGNEDDIIIPYKGKKELEKFCVDGIPQEQEVYVIDVPKRVLSRGSVLILKGYVGENPPENVFRKMPLCIQLDGNNRIHAAERVKPLREESSSSKRDSVIKPMKKLK